jgi:AcrR family transcriptional regulator
MGKNEKKTPMSERILAAAIKLINDEGSIHRVNMRGIAKAAGCAHTNVYNYFESFEDLLWKAFERILDNWMLYTKDRLGNGKKNDTLFAEFILIQIDYALLYSGWYRFIWLEPFPGKAPEYVTGRFQHMQANFAMLISSIVPGKLIKARATKIEQIVHGYLHGELCKLINQRVFSLDQKLHKKRITQNCSELVRALSL